MQVLSKTKLIRTSTVAMSLDFLLKGQLGYLQNHYDVIAVSGADEHLKTVAVRERVQTKSIPMHRSISLFADIVSLLKLYRYFRKEKPSIIHSITPKAGLLSMVAGYFAGIPIRMHTFTGLIFPARKGFMHGLLKNMDRITCTFATHIIPEGEGVKRDLIRYRVTRKPLKVIGHGNVNGIDTSCFSKAAISEDVRFQIRNTWQIKPGDFVYVFVGRLVKDKGINELVSAFVKVNNRSPQTKLLLVGDFEPELDPLDQQTMDVIANHTHIIPVGFQSDVRPFLAVSNALVFPSYREGFPNVPMQACSMDLPCIVSDINGCNEIILHEDNGLIIPVKDEPAIEEAMIRLLEDQTLYQHLVSNARNSIVDRYDQLTLWKLIKEEYDEQLRQAGLVN